MTPTTSYVRAGDVHVAYQVVGDGPVDVLWIPGAASQMECMWDEPTIARWFHRLATSCRLVFFDKRGTGLSDRIEGVPTLEERVDDVQAVLDVVGSTRAALVGLSEGGAIGALYAALCPDRVSSLVAVGSGASGWVPSPEEQAQIDRYVEGMWGTGGSVDYFAPSVAGDERRRAWFARWERLSGSPGTIAAMMRMNARFDIRSVLPTISAPTLVLHRTGDRTYTVEQGRAFADGIPGARFVELPGDDHAPWFEDGDRMLDLIVEFVTGARPVADPDRVLATTMFTDIVDSTAQASRLGDRRWREVLDDYDALVARELERAQGRLVKTTGDGTLATFDGPARAVRCARVVSDQARELGLAIRAGLHAGEIELRGDDVTGLAVVIAQRVCALGGAGEVLVSSTVRDLVVGSGIEFAPHGEHELKGVPDTWRLFAAVGDGGR